ncbi:MAG TPA: PEP-CTERM sorting domain-containing protein [Chthoniobacteraceae bacterium]|nr:PEP-CTERM sorting domain-containing protein [Chthoniobacteraceae bacterium]
MKKPIGITALLAGLLLSTASAATRDWVGGNSEEGESLAWDVSTHWSNNTIPSTPDDAARFLNGTTVSVLVPVGSSATILSTQSNTTVTFDLSAPTLPDTPTLTLSSFLDVGVTTTPASDTPSLVTVKGSGGVLHANALRVGVTSGRGGNQLTFTDGVVVTSTLSNTSSVIGRDSFDNLLQIEQGAKVTVGNLSVGSLTGVGNNRLVITGANSEFTVGAIGSLRGLRVGVKEGTSYADAAQDNYVHVSDGGKLVVTTLITGSSNNVNIGGQTRAHDNYILVEGANSIFELGKGESTGSTTVQIGDDDGLDHGGNYLEIRDGGLLRSGTGHTGAITIYGHDSSDPAAQASNRLTVGDDGTVSVGGAINVTGGLLQLSSQGSLTSASVTVGAGGRFEAAGDDFRTTGSGTTIQNLGTLAVQEETLSLRTGVTLANGATLELHLLDGETAAGLELLSGGSLSIGSTTRLRLVADDAAALQSGASWQLFTGTNLDQITGSFNLDLAELPTLDGGLSWDFSAFDENGGWRVTVIPEPGSVALLGVGFALLALRVFRRKPPTPVS